MSQKYKLARPFIKWAGGKRQLLPQIKERKPKTYGSYYEPFVGGGALLFDLQPSCAVINDRNYELILTYRSIKENVDELIELLKIYEEKNNSKDFYEIREKDRTDEYKQWSDVEKAARLIYLNKTCYNGLYRVNSQGMFNTPFGNYKRPAICDYVVLRAVNDYFTHSDITILNGDFSACVETAVKNDFVYFDPPYHSENNTNFTGYQSGGFDNSEQERLCGLFGKLTENHVKCMLSNSATPTIRDMYAKYNVGIVQANRAINSNGNDRGAVDEVIVTNW